jgi:DNA modification methylase
MKPYYEDGAVTIYCGDCREILPTLTATVLVADPPYGTGYYRTDQEFVTGEMLATWASSHEVVALFGWPEKLIATCTAADLAPDEWITWWPTNARCRGFNKSGLWREAECIAIFGSGDWGLLRQPRARRTTPQEGASPRGRPDLNSEARIGDVWRDESPLLNPNQRGRLHPNQKPVSLMRRLLTAMPAGLVVDPCMGSGSTLLAARDLGRRVVGIEVEECFCEIAARRLGQAVLDIQGASRVA